MTTDLVPSLLTPSLASKLAKAALGHVAREYPSVLVHALAGPDGLGTPRALHPIFFGSYDWHSCVHGHWLLARLLRLMPDLPEFMPVVRGTAPSFRYIGPLLWDANMGLPSWFSKLQPGRPTIYFTMGSTGDTKFFEEAVRVFGNTDFQVLITTGGLAEIPNPPPNVFIAKYAPGDALMAVSDVVVSHGGNGTVYQALSCGVPIIGFPTMFDQEINMRQVVSLGIGMQMSNKEYSGPALDRAVRAIVNETRYRERCRQLAARISRMDGRRRAALHIHDFLEHRNPKEHPVTATAILQLLPPLKQESAVA